MLLAVTINEASKKFCSIKRSVFRDPQNMKVFPPLVTSVMFYAQQFHTKSDLPDNYGYA